ncbi:MAG: nucleotidyltransferase domain-containing protein [Deltaproteobacteria bacterium]|nr:MAG: nucleotidyltransferase domain-containing protein [Deltaproteobacteria bacterium]
MQKQFLEKEMDRDTINSRLKSFARAYVDALKQTLGNDLIAVVLYGSVARGEATAYSDIDLLVVSDGLPEGRFAKRDLLKPAKALVAEQKDALFQSGIWSNFSELIKTREEARKRSYLYLDLSEDAVILFDKDNYFEKLLAELRERLKQMGSARKVFRGYRYWDIKPDFKAGDTVDL